MFQGRFNKFKCDNCLQEVYVKKYPDGWVYIKPSALGDNVIKHYCNVCERKRKEENGE